MPQHPRVFKKTRWPNGVKNEGREEVIQIWQLRENFAESSLGWKQYGKGLGNWQRSRSINCFFQKFGLREEIQESFKEWQSPLKGFCFKDWGDLGVLAGIRKRTSKLKAEGIIEGIQWRKPSWGRADRG